MAGRSIGLYGDTSSGKTTQGGEYAKHIFKTTGKRTLLHTCDPGGFAPVLPLINVGVIRVDQFGEGVDPWEWLTNAVAGRENGEVPADIGLNIYDSGTGICEHLLNSCASMAAAGQDIGGRPAPKFIINKGDKDHQLKIGSNVDSHYMVVQNFLLDRINRSTWLNTSGVDTLWTFSVLRHDDEKPGSTPINGPKAAGKALTPFLARYFNYMFRLVSIPQLNQSARHVLNLDAQPELGGLGMAQSNARYPLDATTPLPATIEPASLSRAITLIEGGHSEAETALKVELGL